MKKLNMLRLVLLFSLAALLAMGCAKKPAPEAAAAGEAPVVSETPAQQEPQGVQEQAVTEAPVTEQGAAMQAQAPAAAAELQPILFDFDQYTLTPQAQQTLADNAAYLKAHPQESILIEGHCDERGSDEYNLALGERRARAGRDYLISLGIAGNRLSTISYGEEKPLDPDHTEAAWAKNRRDEFKVR